MVSHGAPPKSRTRSTTDLIRDAGPIASNPPYLVFVDCSPCRGFRGATTICSCPSRGPWEILGAPAGLSEQALAAAPEVLHASAVRGSNTHPWTEIRDCSVRVAVESDRAVRQKTRLPLLMSLQMPRSPMFSSVHESAIPFSKPRPQHQGQFPARCAHARLRMVIKS